MVRPKAEWPYLLAVFVIGIAAITVYAFPGFMAWDSIEQLGQARAGELTDWHPPMMSAMWGVLDRVIAGPAPMLYLQCSLFLAGAYVVLRRRCTPRRSAVLTILLFVFPPTLAMMAVILKDNLMCGFLLVGCAAITSQHRSVRWASLAALFLAAGMRHNAMAAVLPLLVWLSPWPAAHRSVHRALVGAALAVALTVGASACNRLLTDVETHPFHYSVAPMDFVGTLRFADPLTDDEVRELFAGVPLAVKEHLQAKAIALYDPNRWWGAYLFGPDRWMDEPSTPALREAIVATWLRLLRHHPRAYLANRADMFREFLGLTEVTWTAVYGASHEASTLKGTGQPPQPRGFVQRWLSKRMIHLGTTSLMFRTYPYVVLLIALLVVSRRDRLAIALLSSAVGYLLLLFIATPAPDIRYAHWLMVVIGIALSIRCFASPPSADQGPATSR